MKKLYRVLGKKGRITIPFEIRQRVSFQYNDVLSFIESSDSRSVVIKREKICDNCQKEQSAKGEAIALFDFLNNLSSEQQKAALVHLSVKWAEDQGEEMKSNTRTQEVRKDEN